MRNKKNIKPFQQKILSFITQHQLLKKHQQIAVAVSGGIDSVVLLDVLFQLREILKISLHVVHVNHQLRGKESNADEQFVKKLAKKYGVPIYSERYDTQKIALQNSQSILVAARELRYNFFSTLKNIHHIATAHNANDNAETMLFNFFRGTGIYGITGIPIQREKIVRPLLCVTRSEIVEYAKEHKLSFREDSSNNKDVYSRNFLRHHIIPLIEKNINPSLVQTLQAEAKIFFNAGNFLQSQIEQVKQEIVKVDEKKIILPVTLFQKQHSYLQQMLVADILLQQKIELHHLHIEAIISLCNSQKGKSVELGNGWVVEKNSKEIVFQKKRNVQDFLFVLSKEGKVTTKDFSMSITKSTRPKKFEKNPFVEYVDAEMIQFPVTIRSWKNGDEFFPLGMHHVKKVSDFFVDEKIPRSEKHTIPIIESSKSIVWIAGHRLDNRFKITDKTKKVFKLEYSVISSQ